MRSGEVCLACRLPEIGPTFDKRLDMQQLLSHSRKTAERDFKWLQKKYPDARIIYIVREPAEALPSVINLLESVLKKMAKSKKVDNASRKVWAGNLYTMFVEMQKCFHDDWVSGRIDRDRMKKDFSFYCSEFLNRRSAGQ